MCKPQVFRLWVGSSLAKLPSDGRAVGPRLGLNTSLLLSTLLSKPKVNLKWADHFGPAQLLLFEFWPYLMQNALRNMFVTIECDIHYNEV